MGLFATRALADDVLQRYEGNATPPAENSGWQVSQPCESACGQNTENGHLIWRWTTGANPTGYYFVIAHASDPPPKTLWVEWRFRSNHPIGLYSYTCDGVFDIAYGATGEVVFLYGDAAVSFSGDNAVVGLDIDEFHTYRFESLDGMNYRVGVDGRVFITDWENQPNQFHLISFSGRGGCLGDEWAGTVNEWDFVRYGTISYGEKIVASHPPDGFVSARKYAPLDRFTVTYDSPNYVYIDQITVDVSEGVAPAVIATRRLDNGPPETVEIVLDRPIPYNATTRFTFNDGVLEQSIGFTFAPGDTDGDGDADLADFAAFQNCFEVCPISGACQAFDFNADSAVDLLDFAGLQAAWGNP